MAKLQPNEQLLTGAWIVQDGKVIGDTTCERIAWLVSNHLRKITHSIQSGGWDTLYRDPEDGRYWERTYPQGGLHGGGPPELRCLTVEEARRKYGAPQ
ncbi:MAG: hypothetical protein EPN47_07455 [Acidobacteria bacterium]|nr:MAG: hypothetical protein EPN47_07455 [Acidobacteriota bacterium]